MLIMDLHARDPCRIHLGWRHEAAKSLILCGVQPTVDKFQAAVWWRETVKIHILKQKTNGGRKYDFGR